MMLQKKQLALVVVLLTGLLGAAEGRILFVCDGCMYTPPYFTSIDSAVHQAAAYDTIYMQRGTYVCENVLLDKPLTLLGRERSSVVLTSASGEIPIITITSADCVVRNMTFAVKRTNGFEGAGVKCAGVPAMISDNTFQIDGNTNWPAYGVICESGASPSIVHNNFFVTPDSKHYAVYLRNSSANVSAPSNYWGTNNSDTISVVIHDASDETGLGVVSTTPSQSGQF